MRGINDISLQFLKGGYLLPGQTAEEKVWNNCQKAEDILGIKGFAKRYFEYFDAGFYSFSSPVWSNFGEERGLPISCVVGDTWINTEENGGKQAKDIQIGDKVLTHKGGYRKVVDVIITEKNKEPIYKLVVGNCPPIFLTGDHLVLTQLGWLRTDYLNKETHLVRHIDPDISKEGLNYSAKYLNIQFIEKTNLQDKVYDFTVEEDHSFSAAGVILHNCFGSYISDDMESILSAYSEIGMMTKHGGGTSAYFGDLRPRGATIKDNGQSHGPMPFINMYETLLNSVSQGNCYIEGTEVLTNNGFKDFRVVCSNDQIAEVDEFNNISFTREYELVEQNFNGELKCFSGRKKDDCVNLKVTPNHRMVISTLVRRNNKKEVSPKTKIVEASKLKLHRDNRLILGGWGVGDEQLSIIDRLRIAYQADGIKDGPNRKIRFHFSKQRKIDRLLNLLKQLNIEYITYTNTDKSLDISFEYISEIKKETLTEWVKLENISGQYASEFLKELSFWDGTSKNEGSASYSSVIQSNIDTVQAIAVLANKKTRLHIREANGNRQTLYYIYFSEKAYRSGESIKITNESYNGKVYCAIVPKGRLVVRYQGRVMICGNTRRGFCATYMPLDHPDIMEFLTIHTEASPIQDLATGVCVSDEFMQAMIDGDKEKRKIWAKVLERRIKKGMPYIIFTGNANKNKPKWYKDQNMEIKASNLCCVTGDQIVFTDKGLFSVEELYKSKAKLTLHNGEKFVESSRMHLISDSEQIYEITLANGYTHKVTYLHKILTRKGVRPLSDINIGEDICCARAIVDINKLEEYGGFRQVSRVLPLIDRCYSEVIKIEKLGVEPVYCPEVNTEDHLWICNGIVTHNSEISLPSNESESFVCDLGSMNALYYDEWKDTDAVKLQTYFLDAVCTEFIEKAKKIKFMERSVKFAERHRALGIGVMGWHSYLQSKMIPFESMEAKHKNGEIFKHIQSESYRASQELAEMFGEPEVLKGYGMRNATTMAVAPTKSSSLIHGQVSEGIEPYRSNYTVEDKAKIKFSFRNPHLKKVLAEKGYDEESVWMSILKNKGSVQHLDFLSQNEKDVFKTFEEISMMEVVIQAAQRQKYIDQGQSLNIMIHPDTPIKEINQLMIKAWEMGIKSFYYQYNVNAAQELSRSLLACKNCEA